MKTKEILKRGMCVEFKSKLIGIYNGYDFFDISNMTLITHDSLLDNDLNYKSCNNSNFSVMKIWKDYTLKELLWERKAQILDIVEKCYFEGMLKPFKNKVKYICKILDDTGSSYYINIQLYDWSHITLPTFSTNSSMYKGMELEKQYTTKELDLFTDNYKITLKEFFETKERITIHCDTKEKATKLLQEFDKLGKQWCNGDSYLYHNNWESFREHTCYTNHGNIEYVDYCKIYNYKTYEFEEIELGESI